MSFISTGKDVKFELFIDFHCRVRWILKNHYEKLGKTKYKRFRKLPCGVQGRVSLKDLCVTSLVEDSEMDFQLLICSICCY